MKLNYDCVRDIMLTVEEQMGFGDEWTIGELMSHIPQYNDDDIQYSCLKLHEGGYLNVITISVLGSPTMVARIKELTYKGHKLLDTIRPKPVYEQAKSKVASAVGSASLEVLGSVAAAITNKLLGL